MSMTRLNYVHWMCVVLRRLGRSWSPTVSLLTGGRGSVRLRTRW